MSKSYSRLSRKFQAIQLSCVPVIILIVVVVDVSVEGVLRVLRDPPLRLRQLPVARAGRLHHRRGCLLLDHRQDGVDVQPDVVLLEGVKVGLGAVPVLPESKEGYP